MTPRNFPQTREELNEKSRLRMAEYRKTTEYKLWLERSRENRNRLKTKYRREAGAKPRTEIQEQAKARQDAKQAAKQQKQQKQLHDSHVSRYFRVIRIRARSAAEYASRPDAVKQRAAKRRDSLNDSYVLQNIKAMGILSEAITSELIEMKREAMQFRRLSVQAKTILTNHQKEKHEALTEHS